jgi:glutathione synthase/RimK-type ligase-like ATP-grasp enzyme
MDSLFLSIPFLFFTFKKIFFKKQKKDVAILTCSVYPDLIDEEKKLQKYLESNNITVEPVIWNEKNTHLEDFKICIIRSTYDYLDNHEKFLSFLDETSKKSRLFNSQKIINWNIHKKYLIDLEKNNVKIVPTRIFEKKTDIEVIKSFLSKNYDNKRCIIKRCISAGGANLILLENGSDIKENQENLINTLKTHDIIIQPFIDSIKSFGEISLIYLGEKFRFFYYFIKDIQ